MEIKEVCGFKDKTGEFWDTKEEALRANKQHELHNLEVRLFRNPEFCYEEDKRLYYYGGKGKTIKKYMVDLVELDLLRQLVYMNPDVFIKFCKLVKELADNTDNPEEIFDHNPKAPWWEFW